MTETTTGQPVAECWPIAPEKTGEVFRAVEVVADLMRLNDLPPICKMEVESSNTSKRWNPATREFDLPVIPKVTLYMPGSRAFAAWARPWEPWWHFPRRLRRHIEALAAAGLVGWDYGNTDGVVRVWLTDTGKAAYLSANYTNPVELRVDDRLQPGGIVGRDPRGARRRHGGGIRMSVQLPDHRGAGMTEQGTAGADDKAKIDVDIKATEEKLRALRAQRRAQSRWWSAVDRVWLWSARKLDMLYGPMPCGCSWERVVDVSRGHRPGCERRP